MKAIKILMILVIMGILTIGCSGTRSFERGAQGAGIFGGTAYLLTRDPKIALGAAAVGTSLGAIYGMIETDKGLASGGKQGPTPFPWIKGERVAVFVDDNSYWGESVRAMIEENLRGRGAIIVATPGRRYNTRPEDLISSVYIAEVFTRQYSNYVVVQIRVIDRTNGNIKAIGDGQSEMYNSYYYGAGYDFRSFECAANRALTNLH